MLSISPAASVLPSGDSAEPNTTGTMPFILLSSRPPALAGRTVQRTCRSPPVAIHLPSGENWLNHHCPVPGAVADGRPQAVGGGRPRHDVAVEAGGVQRRRRRG